MPSLLLVCEILVHEGIHFLLLLPVAELRLVLHRGERVDDQLDVLHAPYLLLAQLEAPICSSVLPRSDYLFSRYFVCALLSPQLAVLLFRTMLLQLYSSAL